MDNIEQKANEIMNKFRTYVVMWSGGTEVENENIKQCAIISVDEIIGSYKSKSPNYEKETYWHPIDYWQQVKEKIQSL
jgi:hypothetical protein